MPGLRKGVVALLWPRNSVRSTEMQLMSVRDFNGQKTQLTSASLVLRSQNIAVHMRESRNVARSSSRLHTVPISESGESEMIQMVSDWIRPPADCALLCN